MIFSVTDYLFNELKGKLPGLYYFLFGIVLGLLIFLICLLIIFIVSKSKKRIGKRENKKEINEKYLDIIKEKKEAYINTYSKLGIVERIKGFGKIVYEMAEEISKLYYPDSKDSIFELSIDQLVDFLDYIQGRLNFVIDELLETRLHFFDKITGYSIKDKKLSFVFKKLDKPKEEPIDNEESEEIVEVKPKKKGLFSAIKRGIGNIGKKVAIKVGGNMMNKEFDNLIEEFGSDLNKLYSGQDLLFSDISKRQMRINKRKKVKDND